MTKTLRAFVLQLSAKNPAKRGNISSRPISTFRNTKRMLTLAVDVEIEAVIFCNKYK
jgi:hypothetical protein